MTEKLMTGQQWYNKFVKYAQEHGMETFEEMEDGDPYKDRDRDIAKLLLRWARESSGAD